MSRRQHYPLIEAVKGGRRYEIEEGAGSMLPEERRLFVPLDNSPKSRRIRAHEVAHARWTPEDLTMPEHIDNQMIQGAEDLRMNLLSRRVGLADEVLDALITDDKVGQANRIKNGGPRTAVSLALASHRTGDEEAIATCTTMAMSRDHAALCRDFAARAHAEFAAIEDPTWEDTVMLAQGAQEFADRLADEVKRKREEGDADGGAGEPGGDGSSGGAPSDPDGEASGPSAPGSASEGDGEPGSDGGAPSGPDGADGAPGKSVMKAPPSGPTKPVKLDRGVPFEYTPAEEEPDVAEDPEVEAAVKRMLEKTKAYTGADVDLRPKTDMLKPPRPQRLPKDLIGRTTRQSDRGAVPRHINRYASDRAIFAERGTRIGGVSIAIDTSGSMNLTPEKILDIVTAAPAALIAVYQGGRYYRHAGLTSGPTRGVISVIARDGRRVRDEDLDPGYGAANLCDVPALEWLERQPRPRVWVCDGNVTGRRRKSQYEVLDAKVGEECAVICRRSDILRVDNMEGLNKWLDEHRVRGRGRQKRLAY